MKNRKLAMSLIIAALLGGPAAAASVCQATSTSWEQEISCAFGRAESWGTGSGSSKALHVQQMWGEPADSAKVIGRNSSGGTVSTCTATDTTVDLFPVSDTSGCGTAVKHTLQVNYF